MKVRDIMTETPETVTPGTFIGDVAMLMRDLDIGIVPVVSDSKLLGVITDRDITIRVTASGLNPFEVTVQDFISPNAVSVSPDDDLEKARQLMSDRQIRRLLVTEDDALVGILSLGDLATKDKAEESATGNVLEEISEPTKE
ncbi:MAG TPA: CBS domain-containing protein [Chloroflexia bacterium]|nr:CBS domain-containing protein [Chloroflexia bacterium]